MYCNVILLSRPLSPLTYRLDVNVPVGAIVQVPLRSQSSTGIIVAISPELPENLRNVRIRAIIEVVDPKPFITPPLLKTLTFMSRYYFAPLGFCLKLAIPSGLMRDGRCTYRLNLNALRDFIQNSENSDANSNATHEEYLPILQQIARDADFLPNALEYEESEWIKKYALTRAQFQRLLADELLAPQWHLDKKRTEKTMEFAYTLNAPHAKLVGNKQKAMIEWMQTQPMPIRHSAILAQFDAPTPVLHRLETLGVLSKTEIPRDKTSFDLIAPIDRPVELTDEQNNAVERILACRGFESFLLFGVTGSGKTEVYLHVMERILNEKKGCVFILPEIALTPQFCAVFKGRFGDLVAVLHSGLGEVERFNTWTRIREGRIPIVIGPRSALFSPIQDLGLIVIDEEHDGSFKQSEQPYYNARDMALYLGQKTGCPVILGSATPSLESYYRAMQNRSCLLQLTRRPMARALPSIEIIDMRNRIPPKNASASDENHPCPNHDDNSCFEDKNRILSDSNDLNTHEIPFEDLRRRLLSSELEQAIRETLSRGEQVMIFLNRRGYSTYIQCEYCGNVLYCPNCDVALTYYKYANTLRCHYCGYEETTKPICPKCGRNDLSYSGYGTERLTSLLQTLFPNARIDRLDRDRSSTKMLQTVLNAFRTGQTDILVGTQMIAKGHDIHNVTLVGIVNADMGLNMPDFRSGERTYQLLTQVSGRAGRGDRPGRVIIQTLRPEHPAIQGQVERDYSEFAKQELQIRQALGNPPFTALILITFKSKQLLDLEHFTTDYAKIVRACQPKDGNSRTLGPAPAPMTMLNGLFRFQLFLYHTDRMRLHQWMERVQHAASALCQRSSHMIDIAVDVDPFDML